MTDEAKTDTGNAVAAPAAADTAERPSTIPADEMARLTDEIVGAIKTVYDPEIPSDIYELGLIYKVDIDDDRLVKIEKTLTIPSCPCRWGSRSRAGPACSSPRSPSSGIRRGTPAACRTRRARSSTCGELRMRRGGITSD